MDRIIGLTVRLLLLLAAPSAFAASCPVELAACKAQYPTATCTIGLGSDSRPTPGAANPAVLRQSPGSQVKSVYKFCAATVCTAGSDSQGASVDGQSSAICNNGCEYTCPNCTEWQNSNGSWSTVGTWAQSGQSCGVDDDEPDPDGCENIGASGFQFCSNDPPGCVRSPAGAMLCPNAPGPDCATSPSGAACVNQPPPEGYGPPEGINVCPAGSPCIPMIVAPPEDDEDDDEEDDDDECPANDPNCEDDNQCPEGYTGTPPNCEKDDNDGVCTPDNDTVCDILRDIREATQRTSSNTSLQLKEDRETNTKLAAIRDQVRDDSKREVKAIERVQTTTDAVRNAVNNSAATVSSSNTTAAAIVSTAVNTSATTVSTAVTNSTSAAASSINSNANTNASTLGGKLDTIAGKLDGIAGCGGVGQPACSGQGSDGTADIVNAVNDPDWTHVDPVDAGEGVTQADNDAAKVKTISIGVGDLDESGFGLGSSCPTFPQLTMGGQPWEIDSSVYCMFLDILAAALMLGASLASVYILMGD